MPKSKRHICDIGTPPGAPSKFCKVEHRVLQDAGFTPHPEGTVTWEHPGSGAMHMAPLVEWRKP